MTGRPPPLLGEKDIYLFNEGTNHRLADTMGAHLLEGGTAFAVWAPNARSVSVIGDWNGWDPAAHPLSPLGASGIWEGFVDGVGKGAVYKYHVVSDAHEGFRADKADPFAFYGQIAPETASVVWDLDYRWGDDDWMRARGERNALGAPQSVYEVHLGSWLRDEPGGRVNYRAIASRLADHVEECGFTHVELLPVMEHPFYGSWGYQCTGYFAPTSRYGTPQDLMYLIDHLHQRGIGVILDWVPSHFPTDGAALGYFDGTHLFEHADPRQGFHPDWNSYIFNYGRNEVRSFLMSSAMHWLETYHADGLRVDAVASMLYLDYSRGEGEWIPNRFGGRENIDAIDFLRRFNQDVYEVLPDVQTVAEESTAWPMVSRPTYLGGLGFGLKWDMGWMHDTLDYFSKDPVYRRFHHGLLTFRGMYAWHENFMLPLSHDEVVHGKGSLIGKMPGDEWQRFANLRLLYALMWATPGKKLLFMGGEFAQQREWAHESSLDWHLLERPEHRGIQQLVGDLNRAYRDEPALHERDTVPEGFEWIDPNNADQGLLSFVRWSEDWSGCVLVVANLTPVPRHNVLVGVPRDGFWREIVNTDASGYGGSGQGNLGGKRAVPVYAHGRSRALTVTAPPLGCVWFRWEPEP